jgi:predicted GIY-YIG superfamily endonuclease
MHILYMLKFSSGKSYVGQTVRSIKRRMSQHRRSVVLDSLLPVHCAWRKYGEPELVILAQVETQEELHAAEEAAIKNFNTLSPNGYNVAHGGKTAPSKNPEVAAKIAAKATGRKVADTSRISEGVRRNWQDEEYRQKVSDGLKAAWTKEARQKRSEKSKVFWEQRKASGYVMSDETKQKLATYTRTEETRAKMSASAKLRPMPKMDEAAMARQAAGVARSWADPEVRAKRMAAMAAAWKRRKEKKGHAVEEGLQPEVDQLEHLEGDEVGQAAEAGDRDCA